MIISSKERYLNSFKEDAVRISAMLASPEFQNAAIFALAEMTAFATQEQIMGARIFFDTLTDLPHPPKKQKEFPKVSLEEPKPETD